jgi:hypothetical protein
MKYISSSSYFGRGGRRRSPFVEEELETLEKRSREWYGSGEEGADSELWFVLPLERFVVAVGR